MAEYAPSFIDMSGIMDVHKKVHRIVGIVLIGVPSVAHVLLVFLPPLVDKTKLVYHPPTSFNYSKQFGHLNWTKFWDPAAVSGLQMNDVDGVHMTLDEIYRLLLMFLLFGVLFPLSRSFYLNRRSYSLALMIHSIAAIWYAVDNIRKISHGLSHLFNLPMLIVWLLDMLMSVVIYHKRIGGVRKHSSIGQHQYIDIKVKLKSPIKPSVGDVYYLLDERSSVMERAHPFTCYSNHSKDDTWDIGFIIAIMDQEKQWTPAWTRRLYKQALEQGKQS